MSQHTPGPWYFEPLSQDPDMVALLVSRGMTPTQNCGNEGERFIMSGASRTDERRRVALVDSQLDRIRRGKNATPYDAPDAERDANARLIAAAPDLLALVQTLMDIAGEASSDHQTYDFKARAGEASKSACALLRRLDGPVTP